VSVCVCVCVRVWFSSSGSRKTTRDDPNYCTRTTRVILGAIESRGAIVRCCTSLLDKAIPVCVCESKKECAHAQKRQCSSVCHFVVRV